MGSISTYLVHNSSVPVSVIRPPNKKKTPKKKAAKTPPALSESKYRRNDSIKDPTTLYMYIVLTMEMGGERRKFLTIFYILTFYFVFIIFFNKGVKTGKIAVDELSKAV